MINRINNPTKRPLLIDTDAGTDDAVAICMLMASDAFDIVGITTVGGNGPVDYVTQNVLYLVEKWGRYIPVYEGHGRPMTRPTTSADFIHGYDGFGDLDYVDNQNRTPADGHAVDRIIELSHQYTGRLELMTLGPLTNMAYALQQDPTLTDRVAMCHIMGGLYDLPGNITPLSEYNIWADPEAAQIVLTADWSMTMTGWDATLAGGYLTPDELRQLSRQPHMLSRAIAEMQQIAVAWEKENNGIDHCYLADAAAAAALIDPSIVISHVEASTDVLCSADDDESRGQLVFDGDSDRPVHIYRRIDRARFVELVIDTFC